MGNELNNPNHNSSNSNSNNYSNNEYKNYNPPTPVKKETKKCP